MTPDLEPREQTSDSLLTGCGIGCLVQLAFLFLGIIAATILHSPRVQDLTWLSFGLTQWIVLIPVILKQRANGRTSIVQGMIVVGCLGTLLASGCATLMLH